MSRLFVDGKDGFILPPVGLDFGFFHWFEPHPGALVGQVEGDEFELVVVVEDEHGVLLLVRDEHEHVFLTGHGEHFQLGIAWVAEVGLPLDEVGDGGVVATVVKELVEKGVTHHAPTEVEHTNVPILPTAVDIGLFGHDLGTILKGVGIAQHAVVIAKRVDAEDLGFVEPLPLGILLVKVSGLVLFHLSLFGHNKGAAHSIERHCGAVGRDEEGCSGGSVFQSPKLIFVRTVDFPHFHCVAVVAQGFLGEGVDEAVGAREVFQLPILFATFGVEGRKPDGIVLVV